MYVTFRLIALPVLLVGAWALQEVRAQYDEGQRALDRGDWQSAIEAFEQVDDDDELADAALYWQAYAYNKLGDTDRTLDLVAALQDRFPSSEWRDDARSLALEARAGIPGATDREDER